MKKAITYNKLVRDRIPDIIADHGERPEFVILDEIGFQKSLRQKLIEEARALAEAREARDIENELIDLYEILNTFEKVYHLRHSDLIDWQEKKRQERGGFDKRIYLIRTVPRAEIKRPKS